MGYFFSIVSKIILFIFKAFFSNIIKFDSVVISLFVAFIANTVFAIHPVFSIALGIICFCILQWVQFTKFGFWIVGGLMTFAWASLFQSIALDLTEQDPIWGWGVFIASFALIGMMHLIIRDEHNGDNSLQKIVITMDNTDKLNK